MIVTIETKKGKELSNSEIDIINKYRKIEFGPKEIIDIKNDEAESTIFFVKNNDRIVAFGMLKPIKLEYCGKKYNILGLRSCIAIEKGKGYGKAVITAMVKQCNKECKTGLGFCLRKNLKFFEKCGLRTKKGFIKRFRYKNPITGKITIDKIGDGVYCNGKDKFMKEVLSRRSIVYTNIPFW
jgi:hypothetical protein